MKEMGKNLKRVGAVLLSGSVLFAGAQNYMVTAQAESEYEDAEQDALTQLIGSQTISSNSAVDREETVYVITDANGGVEQTIVSEWLKNPEKKDVLEDASDLNGIENVKGDETFTTGSDNAITWNANGNDIYYQGSTDAQTPVDVKVTYYLDGNEIDPAELAGKSGKVKIRFDYKNNELRTEEVGGKNEDLYVPFTVVSALFLPVDNFQNVSVTNGKVVSDGSRNIVIGVAMPGLKESLDPDGKAREELDEKLEDNDVSIPDYVEIEADASDFALDMTVSVAMPDLISDFDLSGDVDLSVIDDSMERLNDAAAQLTNGTGALKDGTDQLAAGSKSLKDGADQLTSGIGQYTDGVSQLAGGIGQLKGGSSQLAGGAAQVSAGVNELADKMNKMSEGLNAGIAEQQANKAALAPVVESDKAAVTSAVTQYATGVANASANATATVANAAAEQVTNAAVAAAAQKAAELSAQSAAQVAAGGSPIDPTEIANQVAATAAAAAQAAKGDPSAAVSQAVGNAVAGVSPDGVTAAVTQLANDAGQLGGATGAETALTAIASQTDLSRLPELVNGAASLANGASELDQGVSTALNGAAQLDQASGSLKSGSAQLAQGAGKLADGIGQLDEGATKLNSGIVRLDEEGIQKITEAVDGDLSNTFDRVSKVMKLSKDYDTFTKLADGETGKVKFIYRTGAIK